MTRSSVTLHRSHPATLRWRFGAVPDGPIICQFVTATHTIALAVPCTIDQQTITCQLAADQVAQLGDARTVELVYEDQALISDTIFPLIIRPH